MSDNLVFEESLNTEIDQSEFINKKWVYVNDNNAKNYTSQIVIDSTPLSNAGGWINWSEGYIMLPLVVQLTSAAGASLPAGSRVGDYSWAFKNGFWNIINSMTVEFNNNNIIQQTPFLNVFRSFKAHTGWSEDDLKNNGASCGYYPDNAGSWSYSNNDNTATYLQARGVGVGYANNANASERGGIIKGITGAANAAISADLIPATSVAGFPALVVIGNETRITYGGASNPDPAIESSYSCNDGMRKRQEWCGYYPGATTGDENLGQGNINDAEKCSAVFRNVVVSTAGSVVWQTYAKLRLKDLADFFEKTPLLKGSTMRFYINTNQSVVKFSVVKQAYTTATNAITTQASLNITSVVVNGGLTNPLMIASNGNGQGCSPLPADNYTLSVSIYQNNNQITSDVVNIQGGQSALSSCRLYAPVYTMNPQAESKYLSLAPTKRIRYKDIFQYQFNNNGPGAPFNFLVSNGISNITSVLVVPFISKSNTITNVAGVAGVELAFQSTYNPCSPSPAMPDPIMLTNFNILISGVNLFLNNEQYDFEAFNQQLSNSNQLNGGLTTGLASGLISEDMFSRGYRYYYGDCSRTLPSEQGVSRSVQIVGTNGSKITCDLMVFVEFMREITVDISTGARIE